MVAVSLLAVTPAWGTPDFVVQLLTNDGGTTRTINVYSFTEHALSGGDGFDGTFTDEPRGTTGGIRRYVPADQPQR